MSHRVVVRGDEAEGLRWRTAELPAVPLTPRAQVAPPDLQQRAYAQADSQMPDDYRQQFVQELPPDVQGQRDPSDPQAKAQAFAQVTQQRPNLLQEAGNVLKNPVAR